MSVHWPIVTILRVLNAKCFVDLKYLLFASDNKQENLDELQQRDVMWSST